MMRDTLYDISSTAESVANYGLHTYRVVQNFGTISVYLSCFCIEYEKCFIKNPY